MASLTSAYRVTIPTSEYVAPSNAVATTVLDNGVKVVSVAGGKTFPSIVVDINAGSSYETYETAGTFHFLKYFAYKVRLLFPSFLSSSFFFLFFFFCGVSKKKKKKMKKNKKRC